MYGYWVRQRAAHVRSHIRLLPIEIVTIKNVAGKNARDAKD